MIARVLQARLTRLVIVALVPAVVLGVFVAALAAADSGDARIPAALVNEDRLVMTKPANGGKEQTVAAGRLVVTGLTKPADSDTGARVDWTLTNAAQAKDMLSSGAVYAVVTIPRDFSKSIATVSGTDPQQADIRITTDDAHGTLVSQLGGLVGDAIAGNVSGQITTNVVSGLYGGYATVRTSLQKAADGATGIGTGAGKLANGLEKTADGGDALATGAAGLGGGARQLATGASGLGGGARQLSTGAGALGSGAQKLSTGASALGSGAQRLSTGASALGSGARQLSTGVGALATGAGKLADGADSLADGLGTAASGTQQAADGARTLADGVDRYTDGVDQYTGGVDQVIDRVSPALDAASGAVQKVDPAQIEQAEQAASSVAGKLHALAGDDDLPKDKREAIGQLADQLDGLTGSDGSGLTTVADDLKTATSAVQQLRDAGTALQTGGKQLDSGADALADGLGKLPAGIGAAATGAKSLAGGADQLATGADKLATGAAGLGTGADRIATGAAGLGTGADRIATGVSSLGTGADRIASGAAQLGGGADRLASGATRLGTGADGIASGVSGLSDGVRKSAGGADDLASGADRLGSGLADGAQQVPNLTKAQQQHAGKVVAAPVAASADRQHALSGPGEIVSTLIVPVGLWIGAAGLVLLFGAVSRRLLMTGVGTGRLVGGALLRGGVVAVIQALLVVVLLAVTLGVTGAALPLMALVALVAGVAFLAIHQLLQSLFGRAGTVLSIVLLGVQLVAVGGLYPIELVSAPFQAISPLLPLTAAVKATTAVLTGSSAGAVAGGLLSLALWAVLAFVLEVALVARRRTSVAMFGPAPALP